MKFSKAVFLLFPVFFLNIFSVKAQNNQIDSLFQLLNKETIDTVKINILHKIAYYYEKDFQIDSTIIYYSKALDLSNSINFNRGIEKSSYLLGNAYYSKSFYGLAVNYYEDALKISKIVGHKEYVIKILNSIGIVYYEKAKYGKAMDYFFEALDISKTTKFKTQTLNLYNNIGSIYQILKDYEKAEYYYELSFQLSKELNDESGMSLYYTNYGLILLDLNKYDEALVFFIKSLAIDTKLEDTYGIAICLENIADVNVRLKNYRIAEDYYNRAYDENEKIHNLHGSSSILIGLGDLYLSQKKIIKAIRYYEKSIVKSKSIGALDLSLKAFEKLTVCYSSLKNYKKALHYHKLYKELNDSIFLEDNNKHIAELEAKNEKDKIEIENEILKQNKLLADNNLEEAKKIRNILTLTLFVFILFILFLLFLSIKLNRSNKELKKRNFEIKEEREKTQKAKLELKLQEAHLESFMKNANDFVIFRIKRNLHKDSFGEIVFISSSVDRILGFETPNNFKSWFENIHKDDISGIRRANFISGRTGKIFNETFRIFHSKRKEWIWVNAVSNPVIEADGEVKYFNGIIIDVTERKKLENTLTESEEKYRYLIENLSIGVCVIDHNETFLLANEAAEIIFGIEKNKLVGRNLKEFLDKDVFNLIKSKTLDRIKGKRENYDIEISKSNGENRTINIRAIPNIRDKINIGTITILRDVTDEKKSIEALRKSEENFRNLFENSPVSLWEEDYYNIKLLLDEKKNEGVIDFEDYFDKNPDFVAKCDSEYKVVNINQETIKLFKAPSKEYIFNNPESFFTKDSHKIFKKILIAFANDKKSFEAETLYKDFNGKAINTILRIFVFEGYKRVIVSITNISEQKRAEEQLIEAHKQADEANRLKSEFLANMSHEIRTPMNAIIGFSDILQNRLTDPQHLSFINKIILSGNNLLFLINDILDLSKIEAGKLSIEKEPTDLRYLINEIMEIFSEKADSKNIKMFAKIDDELPQELLLDSVRIRQVLLNLVGNGLKFTNKGSLTIKVIVENISNKYIDINICVRDTGIGIPEFQLDTIFESFRQVEGQNTRVFGGTGLGLSITKNLIEMMGGSISVKSVIDIGSEFIISLKNVEIDRNNNLNIKEIHKESVNIPNLKVIYADDVEINREVVKMLLMNEKIEIFEAEDGEEVLELVRSVKPDLILMDIQMPKIDGYEAAKILKADKDFNSIPIIALTAHAVRSEINKFGNVFDDYLTKPIVKTKLIEAISNFYNNY